MLRARRSPRLAPLLLLPALLLAPPAGRPARAGDPPPAEDNTLRLFHVNALVSGRNEFVGPRLGLLRADEVADEARPLFGGEAEEARLPVGGLDELIELLKAEVDPASWESVAGADIRALDDATLVVRNVPDVQAALGAALKRYEDRWLRPVLVEVQAVRLPADLPRGGLSPEAATALAQQPGAALSLTALPGQRVASFAGRQVAYLADYDVEVAQKAHIDDPIMLVANLGLAVDLRAVPSADGSRVLLGLEGRLSVLDALPRVAAGGEGREVETPSLSGCTVRSVVEVPAGVWTLVDGASGADSSWAFLVRARTAPRAPVAATEGAVLPTVAAAGLGRYERRAFDTDRLTLPVRHVPGWVTPLSPSNFTPPEPREVPEPRPAIHDDALLELVRAAVAPDTWSREGASLEARRATLYARAQEPVLAGVGRLLETLERELLWSVETEAEVLEVPLAWPLPTSPLLSAAEQDALARLLAEGAGRRLERARVSSMHGVRNAVRAGREQSYLFDYAVEIAEDSVIANPQMELAFSGVVLDVQPAPTSGLGSAVLALRVTRTGLEEPLRSVSTTVGPLQAPALRTLQLRCDVEVPFGATALAGSAVDSGKRLLVLVSPRLVRSGR